MAIVRIDIPKGTQDGQTSVSPSSPNVNTAADKPMALGTKIAIGYGLLAARTSFQTFTQEVRAGGNEELATDLENAGGAIAFTVGLVATKGLSVIPAVFSEVSSTVVRNRTTSRANREVQFNRATMGARVNFNQGRAYE